MSPSSVFAIVATIITILAFGIGYSMDQTPEVEIRTVDYDSSELFCWHSFDNNYGMSVACRITPADATHYRVEYAMVSNESSLNIDEIEYTGYGYVDWTPIDANITLLATGADSFPDPDDPRGDFFIVRVVRA